MTDLHDLIAAGRLAGDGGSSPAPEPVLIAKTVTANGTYSAEDDGADGYSSVTVNGPAELTVHEVVEGIGANSTSNPSAYEMGEVIYGGQARYFSAYDKQNTALQQRVLSYSEGDNYAKVNCAVALFRQANMYQRYDSNGSGIYPNATVNNYTTFTLSGGQMRIIPDNILAIHPHVAEKYGLPHTNWFNVVAEKLPIKEVFAITTDVSDRALIYKGTNNVYIYFFDYVPVFANTGGNNYQISNTSAGNMKYVALQSASTAAGYSSIPTYTAAAPTSTLTFNKNNIVGTTFDAIDTNGNVLVAANIELSDLIEVN